MAPQRQTTLANGIAAAGIILIVFGAVTGLYAQVQGLGIKVKTLEESRSEDHSLLVAVRDSQIRMEEREKKQVKYRWPAPRISQVTK